MFLSASQTQFAILESLNRVVFYVVNAMVLLVIISMVFRIRHVVDETLIKRECAWIVFLWIICSFWVFCVAINDVLGYCNWGILSEMDAIRVTYFLSYWTLIIRNIAILGIILYF